MAETNVQQVRVALGDSLDVMNWFLKELWNDLQHAPGAGPRVVREDTFKEQYLEESLGKLRAHKRVKSASYDPHNKRIRVCVQGSSKKNQYVNVKQAHALLAEDDVDGVEEFLYTAVVRMIGSLDVDPGDHELHAPGEEDRGATRQDDARRDDAIRYDLSRLVSYLLFPSRLFSSRLCSSLPIMLSISLSSFSLEVRSH